MKYDLNEVRTWDMVLGYENFDGNIRILYWSASAVYLYTAENDEMIPIDKDTHLSIFYSIIDDIRYVAYIRQLMLDYLTENIYLMNHYPVKSPDLMKRVIDYAVYMKQTADVNAGLRLLISRNATFGR